MTTLYMRDILRSMRLVVFTISLLLTFTVNAQTLTISAAYSLKEPLDIISEEFKRLHNELKIELNYAGSGTLATQVQAGAPVDIFISASDFHMKKIKSNLIYKYKKLPISNSIVVVSSSKSLPIKSVSDLTQHRELKIAIGNPSTVPAGYYSKQSLEYHGIFRKLQTQLIHTEHVRQVVSYVLQGEVDIGLVYRTEAKNFKKLLRVNFSFSHKSHDDITYPAAITSTSNNKKLSVAFLSFLSSKTALNIFEKFGFKR